MNKLAQSVLSLYSFDHDAETIDIPNVLRQSVQLISRFPSIVAYAYQAKNHYFNGESLYLHAPDPAKSTAENFLQMIRKDQSYTAQEAEILDLCFVLHAEHGGGNNSAFSTHVVTSTGTDTYSAITAAVGSLKGPLHGGAAIMVRTMMRDIGEHVRDWADEDEIAAYITKILKKEAFDRKGLVYGIGHAVYTLSDPRAELLKMKASELAGTAGWGEEFNLYQIVEKVTPRLFSEVTGKAKDLCANVDFYSGFVYCLLNLPRELFTPIFAISRIAGWCAHRVEELVSGGRIIRPAYRSITPKPTIHPSNGTGTGFIEPPAVRVSSHRRIGIGRMNFLYGLYCFRIQCHRFGTYALLKLFHTGRAYDVAGDKHSVVHER